jgi:hypothetical protein
MNGRLPGVYYQIVKATWRRGLAGLLSVFVFLVGMTAHAHAANSVIPTTPSPFVWVQLDGAPSLYARGIVLRFKFSQIRR